jgi:hypothetical protein
MIMPDLRLSPATALRLKRRQDVGLGLAFGLACPTKSVPCDV